MIEGIYHITEGELNFADARANGDLHEFFDPTLTEPRSFIGPILSVEDANFFFKQTGDAIDPDDD